jgi:serine/threonine protein phosphatase PrpC
MEDAHISIVNLQLDSSPHSFSVYGVFDGMYKGVFDIHKNTGTFHLLELKKTLNYFYYFLIGHGGAAVSLWVANKFEQVFCNKLRETKERLRKTEPCTEGKYVSD